LKELEFSESEIVDALSEIGNPIFLILTEAGSDLYQIKVNLYYEKYLGIDSGNKNTNLK